MYFNLSKGFGPVFKNSCKRPYELSAFVNKIKTTLPTMDLFMAQRYKQSDKEDQKRLCSPVTHSARTEACFLIGVFFHHKCGWHEAEHDKWLFGDVVEWGQSVCRLRVYLEHLRRVSPVEGTILNERHLFVPFLLPCVSLHRIFPARFSHTVCSQACFYLHVLLFHFLSVSVRVCCACAPLLCVCLCLCVSCCVIRPWACREHSKRQSDRPFPKQPIPGGLSMVQLEHCHIGVWVFIQHYSLFASTLT